MVTLHTHSDEPRRFQKSLINYVVFVIFYPEFQPYVFANERLNLLAL
jgi:hypothetical protein